MHRFVPLISIPVVPIFGLLWRMIRNQKRTNYYKNWRSVNEQALYALVATAIKRADYDLGRAEIPSPADIKELHIESEDVITIYRYAESILRALKAQTQEEGGTLGNIEQVLRKQVLSTLNNMIFANLQTSKMFQPRELQRNLRYATEQIERARELGFEDVAQGMEYSLKQIFKDQ